MAQQNSPLFKRSGWIILALFLLTLPFFINYEVQEELKGKDRFTTTFVTLEDHNPDYWKADGPFGHYVREHELSELRDKNAKHFPAYDGNVAVISGGAIHYLDEENIWQEIDTRIRTSQVPGYAFENTRNGIKTWYPNETGKTVEVGFGSEFLSIGGNMTLGWEDEDGSILKLQSSTYSFPEAIDNKVVYHAFLPGVDNEFEIEPDKVKNKLILKSRPEAKGKFLVLSEQMTLPKGWTVKLKEGSVGELLETKNGFAIVDKIGMPQLYVPAPEIYSIGDQVLPGEELPAKWILAQEGQVLTLKMQVEQAWLQDEARSYPVVLDPTVTLFGFRSGFVTNNSQAGNDPNQAFTGTFNGKNHRGWMQFNTASIPDDSRIDRVRGILETGSFFNTGLVIKVNQVSGVYGNYNSGQVPAVYQDLGTSPTYVSFDCFSRDQYPIFSSYFDFGAQAAADLKTRLTENRFQIGIAYPGSAAQCNQRGCRYVSFDKNSSLISVSYCVPFNIRTQPTAQTGCKNGDATFTVALRGSGPITSQQWQYTADGGSTWNDLANGGTVPAISGATTTSLSLSNVPESWEGYLFRYGATNSCRDGIVWSNGAKLNITKVPTVLSSPAGEAICEGGSTSFSGSFSNATSYQWQQSTDGGSNWTDLGNTENFSGVTTTTLNITNAPASLNGIQFRLKGYNACEENFTNAATLDLTLFPTISDNPTAATTVKGQSTSLFASLSGETSREWVYTTNGGVTWTPLSDGGTEPSITGATSNTLNLGNIPLSWDGRELALRGYNGSCGPVYTNLALLTVKDCDIPQAICKDYEVSLVGNSATIAVEDVNNNSTATCGVKSLVISSNSFDCSNVGDNIVTLTITDNNDISNACNATVTVIDNVAPTATCQNVTVQLNAAGTASITSNDIGSNSDDVCGLASLSLDITSFDCSAVGDNTVSLTVTDNNGNSSACDATVTVEDNVAPTATCQNVTVQLNAAGIASITSNDIGSNSEDACGLANLSLDITSFDCSAVGDNTVSLTVTDNNGNSSACDATVTVEDNVAPTATCQNVTVQLNAAGIASITSNDIGSNSEDACGLANLSLDITSFDCSAVGDNTVSLTVTDNNGNASSCQATVSVVDEVDPTLTCPQDMTIQTDPGECGAYASIPKPAPADNCGIQNLKSRYRMLDETGSPAGSWSAWANDQSGFFDLGSYEIQWRAKDASNNESFCSFTLDIIDEEAPEVICKDVTVSFNGEGKISIPSASVFDEVTSFDACGEVSFLSQSLEEVSCENVGETLAIQVVGVDPNGNTSSCTAQVSVVGMPCDFEATDIDCTDGATASYDPVAESFTLMANDCSGYPNGEYSLVKTELCGDGEIIAHVASLSGDGRVGLVMMENADAEARFVSIIKDLTSRTRTEYRTSTGGSISFKKKNRPGVDWLKIIRDGNRFKTYTSSNGTSWRLAHSINFSNFEECINAGLVLYTKYASVPVTAVFDHVKVRSDNYNTFTQLPGGPANGVEEKVQQVAPVNLSPTIRLDVAPNPFATRTQIDFSLVEPADVTLEVYNLQGQSVQRLQNTKLDAGNHRYQWDGTSDNGQRMPSGIYLIQLRIRGEVINKKVLLQR